MFKQLKKIWLVLIFYKIWLAVIIFILITSLGFLVFRNYLLKKELTNQLTVSSGVELLSVGPKSEEELCFQITNKSSEESCNKVLDLSLDECLQNLDNLLCRKFLGTKMIAEIPAVRLGEETNFKKICQVLFANSHPDEESPAFSEVEVNEFCNQMVILLNKKDKNLCQFVFTKFTKKDEKNIRSCEIWADPSPELCKDIENPALLSNCLGKVWTTKSFYENKPDYCKEIANYEYRSLCLFFHNKLNTEKCSDIYSGKENFFKIEANRVYCQ